MELKESMEQHGLPDRKRVKLHHERDQEDGTAPDLLAELCYQAYLTLGKSGKPEPSKQYTVLACIVESYRPVEQSSKADWRVVALATGTKCFPQNLTDRTGSIVDCHAESLLKRCFKRYLLELVNQWTSDPSHSDCPHPFVQLTQQVIRGRSYHLFVSQTPCGCVSRWEGDSNQPDSAQSGVNSQSEQSPKSLPRHHRHTGVNRKPGRGQCCPKAACIHKLAKWNLLGWQGASLLPLFGSPVTVDSIVVGNCEPSPGQFNRVEMCHQLTIDRDELDRARQTHTEANLCLSSQLLQARLPDIRFAANFRHDQFVRQDGKRPAASSIVGWLRPMGQFKPGKQAWKMYCEIGAAGRKLGSTLKSKSQTASCEDPGKRRASELAVSDSQIGLQCELVFSRLSKLELRDSTQPNQCQTSGQQTDFSAEAARLKLQADYRTAWRTAIHSFAIFAGWPEQLEPEMARAHSNPESTQQN